jgi:BMFP domain-containing protein YqiC
MSETNTSENEHADSTPSDARVILGPLVKYALMGLVLVSIIITTAVMLDRQFNDIDQATILEASPAPTKQNTDSDTNSEASTESARTFITNAAPQPQLTTPLVDNTEASKKTEISEKAESESPAVNPVENRMDAVSAVESPASTSAVEQVNTAEAVAADTAIAVIAPVKSESGTEIQNTIVSPSDKAFEALIAERNAYLNQMDLTYLEELKASQQKQLQHMRARVARQEQRIKEMEARFRERYQDRASNVKEMQELRDYFLADRI